MSALLQVSDSQNLPRGFCLGQLSTKTLDIHFVEGSMDHLDHWMSFSFGLQMLASGLSQLSSLCLISPLVKMVVLHEKFQVSFEGPTC